MTSQKIVLSDQDHGLGQIGGGARLKDASLWPRSPQHVGLFSDGIGYLYVDRQARRGKQGDEAGFFFIQFT